MPNVCLKEIPCVNQYTLWALLGLYYFRLYTECGGGVSSIKSLTIYKKDKKITPNTLNLLPLILRIKGLERLWMQENYIMKMLEISGIVGDERRK